jgi:hypothetical protein
MTFSKTTLSLTKFSITAHSIKVEYATRGITDTQLIVMLGDAVYLLLC